MSSTEFPPEGNQTAQLFLAKSGLLRDEIRKVLPLLDIEKRMLARLEIRAWNNLAVSQDTDQMIQACISLGEGIQNEISIANNAASRLHNTITKMQFTLAENGVEEMDKELKAVYQTLLKLANKYSNAMQKIQDEFESLHQKKKKNIAALVCALQKCIESKDYTRMYQTLDDWFLITFAGLNAKVKLLERAIK